MATRCRLGEILVGPDLFVAGVHQPFGARLDDGLLRVVTALEVHTEVLEPVEVLDAALAVGADLVVLRFPGHRDEVVVHRLDAVGVPGGPLNGGAATEVEVPAGHRGGAARGTGTFQDEHPSPAGRCGDGRASAGDPESDHHDVDVVGPIGHRGGIDRFGNV